MCLNVANCVAVLVYGRIAQRVEVCPAGGLLGCEAWRFGCAPEGWIARWRVVARRISDLDTLLVGLPLRVAGWGVGR